MAPRKLLLLEEAKAKLHTSEVPDKMLKREKECDHIKKFITNAIKHQQKEGADGSGDQVLYISGVPGSGKTASVLKVVKVIQATKSVPKFQFVHINGLELTDPRRLFVQLYAKLTGESRAISVMSAQKKLNDRFSKAGAQQLPLLLLIDELDMLCTKRQEVIYSILNWTTYPTSRVLVIAISNTLDLPERILSKRISSRLGTNRLCFQPYEHHEIEEIVRHRLGECTSVITKEAIQLASRKVASFSGDLRKALELLRRAVDVALEEADAKELDASRVRLTFYHVNQAVQESTSQIRVELCLSMSQHEDLLFRTLIKDLESSGLEETQYCRFFHEYKVRCRADCVEPLSSSAAFHLLMEMASTNLVFLSPDPGEMRRRIRLGMSLVEAHFCIRQMDAAMLERSCETSAKNTPSKLMARLQLRDD